MSQHLSSLPRGLILINTEASLHLLGSEIRPCSRILFTPVWWPLFHFWHTFPPFQCVALKNLWVFCSWTCIFITVLSALMQGKLRFLSARNEWDFIVMVQANVTIQSVRGSTAWMSCTIRLCKQAGTWGGGMASFPFKKNVILETNWG